jgi:prepilin-type N-terminal cleavage/methylation domain-containing protein
MLKRAAFTLSEIVIALAVLGTMSGGAYVGFSAVNAYAVTSRLYSEAQAVAQNQIDLILSRGPFNITSTPNRVPIELMTTTELNTLANTVTFPTTAPTVQPLKTNPYYPYYPYYRTGPNQPVVKEGFIYTDPVNGNVIVRGTVKTEISTILGSGTPLSMTYGGLASPLNVRQAKVSVSYTFRNTNYNVTLNTIRAADQ